MTGELLRLAEAMLPADRLAHELGLLAARITVERQLGRDLVARAETAVSTAPDRAFQTATDGFVTLRVADHTWAAGRFDTPSVGRLRTRAAMHAPAPGARPSPCRLFLLRGTTPLADIGALQAFDDGGTLFQVASQFNCLEAPSPCVVPVAQYFDDQTQGPRASISAFPGTLLRHYWAPHASGTRFTQSTRGPHLNVLQDVCQPDVAQVESGYLLARAIAQPERLATALHIAFGAIRVGVHEGVEVVLGHNWHGAVATPHPRIAQVFTSTLAAGLYGSGLDLNIVSPWRLIARQLLGAAYVGTLLAAVTLGKRRVLLTLIGGGVFGNPHDLICDALLAALAEVEHLGASLDVVVNLHRARLEPFLPALHARGGWVLDVDRPEVRRIVAGGDMPPE